MREVMLSIVLSTAVQTQGQTWNEWFRQKKTQIRYLQQQIVALQAYIELGQKGYDIARDGLQLVSDIKQGDFDVHNRYFNSLLQVKPAIAKYNKVATIIALNNKIKRQLKACRALLGNDDLPEYYKGYLNNVLDEFSRKVQDHMIFFNEVMSAEYYSLTDSERLVSVHRVNKNMEEHYRFSKEIYHSITDIVLNRQREINDAKAIEKMYDVQNP